MKLFIYALKCWVLSALVSFLGLFTCSEMMPVHTPSPPDPIGLIMVSLFLSCAMFITIIICSVITDAFAKSINNFKIILSVLCFGIWLVGSVIFLGFWFYLLGSEILIITAPIIGLLIGIWIVKPTLREPELAIENEDILDADM